MTLDCLTENMGIIKDLFEGSCEHTLDSDISLPDYYPEIIRVLKCCVSPKIISNKITGDRACADGNALIRIIYADENNNICTYEQDVPFSKYVQIPADCTGTLFTKADTQYVNCRAVSKRRVEINGVMHIVFKICTVSKNEIISTINQKGVQLKTSTEEVSNLIACDCKQFSITETVELPADYLPVEQVINCCMTPILNDTRVVNDKILLKGELCVNLIYCTRENHSQTVKFSHSIPINQVIDATGITENSSVDIFLDILSDECIIRNDSNSDPRLIEVNSIVNTQIKAYEQTPITYITDAYCTDGELNAKYEAVTTLNRCNRIHETVTLKNTVDLSAQSIESLCCMWFNQPKIGKSVNEGKLKIHSSIPVNIIALDSDGKPVFCQREFDFDFEKNIDVQANIIGNAFITNTGHSIGTITNGKAEIKAEFIVDADAFSSGNTKILVDAVISPKEQSTQACIAIYFPDEEETLWDIARKFNTTVDAIKEQNAVSDEITAQCQPILIPVTMN